MFLRLFSVKEPRTCLRWEHTCSPGAAPVPASRASKAVPKRRVHGERKKQPASPARPVAAHTTQSRSGAEPHTPYAAQNDDFVHVSADNEDEMHDFELI